MNPKKDPDEEPSEERLGRPDTYPPEEYAGFDGFGENPEWPVGVHQIRRLLMIQKITYKPKQFNLSGLQGISDKTLQMHFKLYEGYVKNTNTLNERIAGLIKNGPVEEKDYPAYSELTRRLGFEYNGMVLHEYYFQNLKSGATGAPAQGSVFMKAVENSFGSYEAWKSDFVNIGKMRGVGWAITYQDPMTGGASNHWVTLHHEGNVAGFAPLLVMDVWEHAFLLDYAPAERPKYIEAFFSNIDWDAVQRRTGKGVISPSTAA